jgi:hypothetical protein
VGPRAGLDGCGKSRPPPGFDPQTIVAILTELSWPHILGTSMKLYSKVGFQILAGEEEISVLQSIQTGFGAHITSYLVGGGGGGGGAFHLG